MKKIELLLNGLNCANCANKIENKLNDLEMITEVNLNFSLGKLTVKYNDNIQEEDIFNTINDIVVKLEPHVKVERYNKSKGLKAVNSCNSDSCKIEDENHHKEGHEHGHSHDEDHGHSHNHGGEGFSIKDNVPLFIGIALYIVALIIGEENKLSQFIFIAAYIFAGGGVVKTAISNIFRGELFDENFLMTIATVGAFLIGEHPEAVAVMIFYEVGEMFQDYAVSKSRKSISSLMDIKAEYAVKLEEEKEIKVAPEDIKINDIIIIKPGERVPLDGIIIEGNGALDTSALTGESLPREVEIGQEILAGAINLNSVIKVKVIKEYGESTVARILELVENANSKKGKTEKFITKFARYYTPAVVFFAVALAIIPPLVLNEDFSVWIYRALTFLVVSCPCALVVSVPLGLFAGIGGASKQGVLIKGGNFVEALKNVDTVVFDKTGTLTKGEFGVTEIKSVNIEEEELLEIAALGESFSNHPIAQSIVRKYNKEINKDRLSDYKEISGHGISLKVDGKDVLLGNYKLMNMNNVKFDSKDLLGTIVHVAREGQYLGYIVISDTIKETSKDAITKLKEIGVKKCIMLTGDNKSVAERVANEIGLDGYYAELLPGDKVEKIEEILNNAEGKVAFVGDGINDAPVLARADVGFAMGGIGSDAAIEAADVVLMRDDPKSIADAILVGRKTTNILWQNIAFALIVKVFVMILVSFGLGNMWEAVFADVGVTLIAVLNSMRALKK